MYCWEAAKRSQAAITELLLFRKSTGVILRDALPALQRRLCACAYGPFEDCQVRMFVKQRRKNGWSIYLLPKKYLYSSKKRSNLCMICFNSIKNFRVIIYALCIGMRSQMLYTNGSFEIWQVRMFVKQRRTHGWSSTCRGKIYLS